LHAWGFTRAHRAHAGGPIRCRAVLLVRRRATSFLPHPAPNLAPPLCSAPLPSRCPCPCSCVVLMLPARPYAGRTGARRVVPSRLRWRATMRRAGGAVPTRSRSSLSRATATHTASTSQWPPHLPLAGAPARACTRARARARARAGAVAPFSSISGGLTSVAVAWHGDAPPAGTSRRCRGWRCRSRPPLCGTAWRAPSACVASRL
jgi:hypothetical protein